MKQEEKYIAIYCRESTKAQAKDGYNLVEQEKKIKAYIDLEEIKGNVKVYSEYGASAKTLNRPVMKKLIEDIKQGKVERVIIYKLDRLVRRLLNLGEMLNLFKEYKVNFISVKEKIDTKTATGRMFINLVVLFAEWEQDTISERTIEGLIGSASVGNYVHGGRVAFGYRRYKDRQVVEVKGVLKDIKKVGLKAEREELEIVRNMFLWAIEGKSVLQIVLLVNELEYMRDRKRRVNESFVSRILNNKLYCGYMFLKNEKYKLDIEQAVSEEEYKKAHMMINRRKKIIVNDYVYKDKVYCACGELCVQVSTNKHNANGKETYLYYYCAKCNKRIGERILNHYILANLIESYKKFNKEKDVVTMKEELERIEELKESIYDFYIDQKINTDTYIQEIRHYESDYNRILEKYSNYINDFENYFNKMNFKDKAKLVSKDIKKIVVDMGLKVLLKIEYKNKK